ncbi:hypothetical protein ACIOG4_28040 [Streptomyces microflavus]|uniref:hypothetical protein n=1 Tax=Streptomyces microflavus TaxID=1919 RepID=UPI0038150EEE
MPLVYLRFSRGHRVRRSGDDGQVVRGTVTHVCWDSSAGASYFIQWDGAAIARRYTSAAAREQGVELD